MLLRFFTIAALVLSGSFAVLRTAAAEPSGWLPGADAVADSIFDGYIDAPIPGAIFHADLPVEVAGWVTDRFATSAAGIEEVQIYASGSELGDRFVAYAQLEQPRPDVARVTGRPEWVNAGFLATIPAHTLRAGDDVLTVWAYNPASGWWYQRVAITVIQPPVTVADPAAPALAFQPVVSPNQPPASPVNSLEAQVIALVNAERARFGLVPLVEHPALASAARDYSALLASSGCWGHTCGPEPSFVRRAELAGYTGFRAMAENIAGGSHTADEVVGRWMSSEGHRTNILNPGFREIGVGVAYGGQYGIYWTQIFGAR